MSDKLAGGIKAGSTSVSLPLELRKSADSTEQTAKVYTDVTGSYWRQGGVRVAITMATLGSVNAAYSSGGFVEVDGTNMPGVYRFDVPDAAFATGADWVVVTVKVASCFVQTFMFELETVGAAELSARTPAALVSGRMDSSTGAMAANVITATAIASDAITAAKIADGAIDAATFAAGAINAAAIAADAITDAKVASDVTIASVTGAVGSVSGAVGSVTGAVGSVTGAVGSVTGSVGSVATGGITAASFAADAITAAKVAADVSAEIAVAVRDINNTSPAASSLGAAVNSAASAGDPWATSLPGAYGAGTAGFVVGTYLDSAVGDVPTATENADALLKRDWTSISGEASRSALNALRFIRNGFSISGATLTVLKEDDTSAAYTRTLTTDAAADPVTGVS